MIPRNQSRLSRRKKIARAQGIRCLIMFMTFAFWTGYILLGPSKGLLQKDNLLAAELPLQFNAAEEVANKDAAFAGAGFWGQFGQAVLQTFLGNAAGRAAGKNAVNLQLPWVGEELLWSQSLEMVQATASLSGERFSEGGVLEEDYTLLEDPYAASWPEYPDEHIMLLPQGEPRVLLYHTHNSEGYVADGTGGQGGAKGVIGAARVLMQSLEGRFGIKTAHSEAVNDQPDFTKSYLNSFNVVNQFLRKYPDLETIIDVHRDAGFKSREDTLVMIQGRPCARLLLVVGNAHENYEKNLAFAKKIQAKADSLYPGLMKPVRLADKRRYNQQIHSRAILLEVGSNLNYQTDADNAMSLFADVLAEVLNE